MATPATATAFAVALTVALFRLLGANRRFVEDEVPYLPDRLRPTVREVVEASEVIVVSNGSREYR